MRINILSTLSNTAGTISEELINLLRDELPQREMTVTDEYPDLVHIFGEWNADTKTIIKKWHKVYTPVVFTPINALEALCQHNSGRMIKSICRSAELVITQGKEELQIVEKRSGKKAELILNPTITTLTNKTNALQQFLYIYNKVYEEHDKLMRETCQKKVLRATDEPPLQAVLLPILYCHYLFQHGTCYQHHLTELASTMISIDYDEDALALALKEIRMYAFSARLMHVLEKRGFVTEGFIPIETLDDKETQRMDAAIRQ